MDASNKSLVTIRLNLSVAHDTEYDGQHTVTNIEQKLPQLAVAMHGIQFLREYHKDALFTSEPKKHIPKNGYE